MKILRVNDVAERLLVNKQTVWRWASTRDDFPKPFYLAPRRPVWDDADITEFLHKTKESTHET